MCARTKVYSIFRTADYILIIKLKSLDHVLNCKQVYTTHTVCETNELYNYDIVNGLASLFDEIPKLYHYCDRLTSRVSLSDSNKEQ